MFASSSKRACSSTRTATSLPFSTAACSACAIREAGDVEGRVELEEIRERGEAFAFVEILELDLQLLEQRGQDVGRQIAVVLQPHRRSQTTLAQALLDAREEVLGPARGLEIGVARDADGVAGEDVVAGLDRR